jgi:hypothetical protein
VKTKGLIEACSPGSSGATTPVVVGLDNCVTSGAQCPAGALLQAEILQRNRR